MKNFVSGIYDRMAENNSSRRMGADGHCGDGSDGSEAGSMTTAGDQTDGNQQWSRKRCTTNTERGFK
jgi:hypothetical protein